MPPSLRASTIKWTLINIHQLLPTQKDDRIPVHEVITNTRLCRPGSSKCMKAQVVTVSETSEINWLSVDYLCPETCKQYSWINTKYISSSEEGEYLSSGEHHCFFLLLWWISSFGCILGKHQSIFSSSYLDFINLHISKLLDLRGLFKTLFFVSFSVIISITLWHQVKNTDWQILPLCLPHKTLLMWKQSQRILQFKLVDTSSS